MRLLRPWVGVEDEVFHDGQQHDMQAPSAAEDHVLTRPSQWICTIDGCGKVYTKESRLIEHQRVHTGEVRC